MWRFVIIHSASWEECALLQQQLNAAGHSVRTAVTGCEGLELARRIRPDLVLLDFPLPDFSETEIFRQIKREPRCAKCSIMALSGKSAEVDRVIAFELGVDDYLVKPVGVREVMLRVQAVLRRRVVGEAKPRSVDRFGRMKLDREARLVWVDEKVITITALEFDLLLTLYDRRGRTCTRAALLRDVWQNESIATTRKVDQHVRRLRARLGPARAYIETVHKEGYRFIRTADELP